MLESHFDKVTRMMACSFIKKEAPTEVISCEYHKMLEKKALFMEQLWWLLLKKVKKFLRIFNGGPSQNDLYDLFCVNITRNY